MAFLSIFLKAPKWTETFLPSVSAASLLTSLFLLWLWLFVKWWKTLLMWWYFSLSCYWMRLNSGTRGRTSFLFSLYLMQWKKSKKKKKGTLASAYFSFSAQTKVLERWYLLCKWVFWPVKNFKIFTKMWEMSDSEYFSWNNSDNFLLLVVPLLATVLCPG